jgi:hypothetical protein
MIRLTRLRDFTRLEDDLELILMNYFGAFADGRDFIQKSPHIQANHLNR